MKWPFAVDWRMTALTACVLPLLIFLGFWQLERADEKRRIEAQFNERRALGPVPIDSLLPTPAQPDELAFVPVGMVGRFDPEHVLLLDNRIQQGQVGYDLVVPFEHQAADGKDFWVLVNIGWVKAPTRREQLPTLPALNADMQKMYGEVYVPPGAAFLLAENRLTDNWPQVIQALDTAAVAKQLDRAVFPYEVRISAYHPAALGTDWIIVNSSPAKHTAYAVQWFAMALALIFWFIFASRKKHD